MACQRLRAADVAAAATPAAASIVVSLASSDPPCAINASLSNLLSRLAPSSGVVLHIGCGSSATDEERLAFGRIPRVTLNPDCLRVRAGDGSILHAHLLNAALLAAAPPCTLVMASADMHWLANGIEAAATRRVSSALSATWIGVDDAIQSITPRLRRSFAGTDLDLAVGERRQLVVQKHEGSFYPWSIVRDFTNALCERGPLERLHKRGSVFASPVLSLVAEETLLPSFASARLNASGRRARSITELDDALSRPDGILCGFEMRLRGGEWRCKDTPRRAVGCVGSAVFARKVEGPEAHGALVGRCAGVKVQAVGDKQHDVM